jgi:hypothetical protein
MDLLLLLFSRFKIRIHFLALNKHRFISIYVLLL